MSDRTPLSDAVRAVCGEHFNGKDSGCAECPIKRACHSGPTANLTHERMEEWRLRLNEAAAAVTNTPPEMSINSPEIDTSAECVDWTDASETDCEVEDASN